MTPKRWIAGWMPIVLGLVACGQRGPAVEVPAAAAARPAQDERSEVRIEKNREALKQDEAEVVIHTPVFHGIADPAVLERLQASIDAGVREVTGYSPGEWKTSGDDWLREIDYAVTYNAHGLLSLAFSVSGSGAYPSTHQAYVVADLGTGRRLTARDLFKPASLEELAAKVDRLRLAEVEKDLREHRAHLEEDTAEGDLTATMELARQSFFVVEDLDTFRLEDKGVTFVYDFGFPHVIQALEPSGEYFLSYEELRPYFNPEGPLARLPP